MVKECKVLLNNEASSVILYDGVKVQIPPIGRTANTVKVKDDGHYTVVDDDYTEPKRVKRETPKAARNKKTPV